MPPAPAESRHSKVSSLVVTGRLPNWGGSQMRSVHEGCCGLDVHKKTVVAWVITPEVQEGRSFSTMTKDLLALADWLAGHRATG